jgi:hypothetical protein
LPALGRRGPALLVLLASLTTTVGAQVTGRVVRIAAGDTIPAAMAMVTIHRVGTETQGAVDSSRTGADGRFRFPTVADSGDVLLVSANWHGVEYFASPVILGEAVTVIAIDTSSTAPVSIAARHVIVGGPAADGTRDVIDLVVLRNTTSFTRTTADQQIASWTMLLPPQIANLTVGDADFAPDAFDVFADTLLLHAPIPPGERQFFLQYQLPPNTAELQLPLEPRPDTLSILTEENSLKVGDGMVRAGIEEVQGREFIRYSGGEDATSPVMIRFPDSAPPPGWLLPVLLMVVALPILWVTRRVLLPRPES